MPIPGSLPFENELPGAAFQRFLAQLQAGGQFAPAVQGAVKQRGAFLENLAPLYGAGVSPDQGGQSFFDFFQNQAMNVPQQSDVQQRLRDLLTLQRADPTTLNPAQAGLRGAFTTAGGQFNEPAVADALISSLLARTNPALRGGMGSLFNQMFQQQQAVNPAQPFLEWAQQRGWI